MSVRISVSSILTHGVHPLTHQMFYCVWLRREQLRNMTPCNTRITPLYTIFSIILRVHYLLECTSTQKIDRVHKMPCMLHGTMGSINTETRPRRLCRYANCCSHRRSQVGVRKCHGCRWANRVYFTRRDEITNILSWVRPVDICQIHRNSHPSETPNGTNTQARSCYGWCLSRCRRGSPEGSQTSCGRCRTDQGHVDQRFYDGRLSSLRRRCPPSQIGPAN